MCIVQLCLLIKLIRLCIMYVVLNGMEKYMCNSLSFRISTEMRLVGHSVTRHHVSACSFNVETLARVNHTTQTVINCILNFPRKKNGFTITYLLYYNLLSIFPNSYFFTQWFIHLVYGNDETSTEYFVSDNASSTPVYPQPHQHLTLRLYFNDLPRRSPFVGLIVIENSISHRLVFSFSTLLVDK